MVILALLIATTIPLIVLYIIYTFDLYKTGVKKFVLLSFLWGGVAYLGAYYTNRTILQNHWVSRDNIILFGAPILEEILKCLILIYLVRRPRFTYFVDGAVYGFAVGIGFAVFENYEYIFESYGSGVGVAITRVLSTNLIHASAAALVGIAAGLSRFGKLPEKVGVILAGLLSAIMLHSLYNNVVFRVETSMLLTLSTLIGIGAAALIAFTMLRGLAVERSWIQESLGRANRVPREEVGTTSRLIALFAPLEQYFGPEKMPQVERFLIIQARLGILRKTLEKLNNDEKMRNAVEKQIQELREEMDRIRKAMGAYNMLHLTSVTPSESSPLWDRVGTLITERLASRAVSTRPRSSVSGRPPQPISQPEEEEKKSVQPGDETTLH